MIPVDRFNSNPVIPDVADEQPAVRRDCNAVRLAQRADGGAAVAGKSRLAGAGNGGYEPRSRVDAPRRGCRARQCRGAVVESRAACSATPRPRVRHLRGALLTVAGDRDRLARSEVESPNPLIVQVAKI